MPIKNLFLLYRVIKRSVKKLICELAIFESEYFAKNNDERELFYYEVRDSFNERLQYFNFHTYGSEWVKRAAQIIFLNRTCYNGLFRVNRNGEFNVPFGRYKNPDILNRRNLGDVALLLKDTNTQIMSADFTQCRNSVDDQDVCVLRSPVPPAQPDLLVHLILKGRFFRDGPGAARRFF